MSTISLICTVRDEADNIAALLDSMLAQRRPPDEIVINDCNSRDATPEIVRRYAAQHPQIRLVAGGHNISSGRNNAIAHARGDLIASTDAGLELDPGWLEHLIAPLEAGHADHVGGFPEPAPRSLFERVLGATNYREASEIDTARFLPFGQSMAFRREVWEAVGGFPEWADHCEDLVFDLAARRAGFRQLFVPEARLAFRPRSSLLAYARQYFYYARGDAVAGLWPRRHALRYAAYNTAVLLVWLAVRFPAARWPIALLLAAGAAAYTRRPYRRLWPRLRGASPAARLGALALVPLLRLVGDYAKMIGYLVGLLLRWQRRRAGAAPHITDR
jgi:glycosyltransferase involved in cell wall biosynthesis